MMKKLIVLAVLAVFGISSSASAQEFVYFGVKGGVNFTNMTSDGFAENNSRTGFHLGLLSEIPVGQSFSIQPEVLYSTQGTEANYVVSGDAYSGTYDLDYLQVPVLAKIYLIEGFSLELGPSFNFLVNEELDPLGNNTTDTEFGSTFEFGGALGASYKFNNGFFASARYTQGFTDAFDSENWNEDAVNNNGIQLGVGLMF